MDIHLVRRIARAFEAYLFQKKKFVLDGVGYDMCLLKSSPSTGQEKYHWTISSYLLDGQNELKTVKDILKFIQSKLSERDYLAIAGVSLIESRLPIVQNVNFIIPNRLNEEFVSLFGITIGHYDYNESTLFRSSVTLRLVEHHVTVIYTRNKQMNAGIISMDSNFDVKFYTAKGLKELVETQGFSGNKARAITLREKGEQFLINNGYIGTVNLFDIEMIQGRSQ